MEYRRLGRTGLNVNTIGLGTEFLVQTKENMKEVLGVCVSAGVNYIDVLFSNPQDDAPFWDSIGPELNRYRDKLILTVHWGPPDMYPDPVKCQQYLELALERMDNRYFEGVMLTVVDTEKTWQGWSQRWLRPTSQ